MEMVRLNTEEVLTGGVERLRWSVAAEESEIVVALAGELDLATVDPLGRLLGELLQYRPTTVAVDAARLSFLDSSGIQCLVDAAQAATNVGCKLVVQRPTANVVRVLGICGLDQLLLADAESDPTARR